MKITIHCDQTDCTFNTVEYIKENSIPEPYCICQHPLPHLTKRNSNGELVINHSCKSKDKRVTDVIPANISICLTCKKHAICEARGLTVRNCSAHEPI